jgi:hypothetical protein
MTFGVESAPISNLTLTHEMKHRNNELRTESMSAVGALKKKLLVGGRGMGTRGGVHEEWKI